MIEVIKATKHYKVEYGDLICDWFTPESSSYLDSDNKLDTHIVPLCTICPNPWNALSLLGIDYNKIVAKYKCPYTGYEHFAIVPTTLFLLKGNKNSYSKIYDADYVFDWKWHSQMSGSMVIEELVKLTVIQRNLIGSGFTSDTGFSDGSGSIKCTRVNLSNGDVLWVNFWIWFNK